MDKSLGIIWPLPLTNRSGACLSMTLDSREYGDERAAG
jgi:hypothetical protein